MRNVIGSLLLTAACIFAGFGTWFSQPSEEEKMLEKTTELAKEAKDLSRSTGIDFYNEMKQTFEDIGKVGDNTTFEARSLAESERKLSQTQANRQTAMYFFWGGAIISAAAGAVVFAIPAAKHHTRDIPAN